jgi:hypothetical protein
MPQSARLIGDRYRDDSCVEPSSAALSTSTYRGWRVVAVDVSHTALQRAAADALYRGLERHAVSPTARSTRSHIDRLVKNALLGDGQAFEVHHRPLSRGAESL